MPFPVQIKRSGTAAATPSSLLHGEVALNYADGKLFWKDASNVIQSFTFQAYALSSHTHAASDITSGTLDAARIANDSITYAKIQNVSATDRLLGRSSAGAGDVEEIVCTSFGRALLDDTSHAAQLTTLGAAPLASPTFTGTVTVPGLTATAAILADDLSSANSVVYSFDGDPNSGIGRAGADILTLVTNGSERVRVGSGGRVDFKYPGTASSALASIFQASLSNGNFNQVYIGRAESGNECGTLTYTANATAADSLFSFGVYGNSFTLNCSGNGEVLVGGTGDNGAYNLQCNGTGVWGAGAYVNGSDERIKDDITPLGEATSVIAAMQPVTFRYKPTWSSDQSIQPGFIAQQLQGALAGTPYLDGVVQQGTEYLSVAYQSLIPLLVKALQESNARIAALEERNHA